MSLTFVQLAGFLNEWKHFRLTDDDLRALEGRLMENPEAGAVMAATGGLRKVRFAPPSRHSGKSGAYRVGYVYFPVARAIFLLAIFAKNDKANLSSAERTAYQRVIQLLKNKI